MIHRENYLVAKQEERITYLVVDTLPISGEYYLREYCINIEYLNALQDYLSEDHSEDE